MSFANLAIFLVPEKSVLSVFYCTFTTEFQRMFLFLPISFKTLAKVRGNGKLSFLTAMKEETYLIQNSLF